MFAVLNTFIQGGAPAVRSWARPSVIASALGAIAITAAGVYMEAINSNLSSIGTTVLVSGEVFHQMITRCFKAPAPPAPPASLTTYSSYITVAIAEHQKTVVENETKIQELEEAVDQAKKMIKQLRELEHAPVWAQEQAPILAPIRRKIEDEETKKADEARQAERRVREEQERLEKAEAERKFAEQYESKFGHPLPPSQSRRTEYSPPPSNFMDLLRQLFSEASQGRPPSSVKEVNSDGETPRIARSRARAALTQADVDRVEQLFWEHLESPGQPSRNPVELLKIIFLHNGFDKSQQEIILANLSAEVQALLAHAASTSQTNRRRAAR